MNRTQSCVILAAVLAVVSAVRPAAAAERVPVERLLPPNVFALATVPDVEELKARWDRTQLGQLRDDPQLADFWRDFDAQWGEMSEEVEQQLGITLDELLGIPSGEASLALMQPPGPRQKMALVGFLDFGDSDEAVETVLDRVTERLERRGARRREDDDTRIVTYTLPAEQAERDDDEDEPRQAAERKFSYFVRDSWLVVAGEPAALEAVLVRWDGRHALTFADSQAWRDIVERTRTRQRDAAVNWYFDPVGVLRASAQPGEGNMQMQLFMGLLPLLGLDRLKGVGGSVDLATEDYDSVTRTLISVEQPATGLLDVFRMPAADLAPPRWVPATATTYYGFNWDAAGAYDAVERLVDLIQGQGAFDRIIDGIAGSEDGPQIHLKKDVVDQLTGRLHVFYQPAGGPDADEDDESAGEPFVFAAGLKRSGRMQAVLAELAKADGFPGRTREFRGRTLYEISPGDLVQNAADTVGLAVVNDHLMIASNVTLLEQVMRDERDRAPLAESPEYRRLARHFPARTSMIGFQQEDTQLRSVYEMLRSREQLEVAGLAGLDFSKLPPFEAIQKYIPATGSYIVPDERGALLVSFSLRNAEK